MSQTYYLRNTTSDLAGGLDFNYKLLTAVAGEATATIQIAKSATEESYGFTEPNIPNNADWETGTTVVKVKVTAENSNIWGSIRVDRVSAAGALVESSTTTAEQQFSSVATYTFTVASKDWTAGTIGDRLRVAYIFRNAKGNAQSFDISYNTSNSSVVTSVITEGRPTKSLQYSIYAHKVKQHTLRYVILGETEDYATWLHSRGIDIANPVSQTNFQHKIVLPYISGMNADFSDIRFAQNDGTYCSYWIESKTDSTTATVWIKIPSASQSSLMLYYGNIGAESTSSGNDTFELFDDFLGADIDTGVWTTHTGTHSCASSILTHTSSALNTVQRISSTSTFAVGTACRVKSKVSSTEVNYNEVGGFSTDTEGALFVNDYATHFLRLQTINSSISTFVSGISHDTNYHIFDIRRISTSSVKGTIDGGADLSSSTNIPTGVLPIGSRPYTGSGDYTSVLIDWILVRKTTATEPTLTLMAQIRPQLQYSVRYTHSTITKPLEYRCRYTVPPLTKDLEYKIPQIRLLLHYAILASKQVGYPIVRQSFTSVGTTSWTAPTGVTNVEVLVVAGGGGGGSGDGGGGGGGAGGLVYQSEHDVVPGTAYTITVGGKGTGGAYGGSNKGSNGTDSIFDTITAIGGGGGGSHSTGNNGGSGGGGGYPSQLEGSATQGDSGGGTGYGNDGGVGGAASGAYGGGGGGGADTAGATGTTVVGGDGGAGTSYDISGSSLVYAAGGGGGTNGSGYTAGVGGSSVGGEGGNGHAGVAASPANRGSGGGGGGSAFAAGGNGSDGIVLLYCEPCISLTYDIVPDNVHVEHIFHTLSYSIKAPKKTTYALKYTHRNTRYIPKYLTYIIKPTIVQYTLSYQIRPVVRNTLQYTLAYSIKHSYQDWAYDTIIITDPVDIVNFQHKLDLVWHPTINADFSDIRFMQLDLTNCPYYIDPHTLVSGVSCTVWIKVPTANQTELRMYHCGDVSYTSQSTSDIFEFFDDFEGVTLDAHWTPTGAAYSVSGSVLHIGPSYTLVRQNTHTLPSTYPIVVECYCNLCPNITNNSYEENYIGLPGVSNGSGSLLRGSIGAGMGDARYWNYWWVEYNGTFDHVGASSANAWYTHYIVSSGTGNTTATYYRGGSNIGTRTVTFHPYVELSANPGTGSYEAWIDVDWVRARKYVTTEPTLTVTKRQLGEFLKYVVRNHAPVKTLSLYYLCAHNLVTTQYSLKYVIQSTHVAITKGLAYSIPYITITATPTSGELFPLNVTFQAAGINTIPSTWAWTWDFDGDIGGTGYKAATGSIMHQFVDYGEYDVTCTASTTSGGSSNTATTHVSVTARTLPTAVIYHYIQPGTRTVDFYGTYCVGALTYEWDFGDGTVHGFTTNPVHTYAIDNNYDITLTVTNGAGSDVTTGGVLYLPPLPVADFELERTPEGTTYPVSVTLTVTDTLERTHSRVKEVQVAAGPFTKFKDLSTGKIKHWEWDFGDGNI